jgi:Putative 8-oxoguanine DNA glycosylase OGG-like protein
VDAKIPAGWEHRVPLPSDAYTEDVSVVQNGLLSDEREWFEAKRLVLDSTNGRAAADIVAEHTVDVPAAQWTQYSELLGSHMAFPAGELSRGDLFELAQHHLANAGSTWLEVLGASYVWGYGPNGLGPTRLARILHGHNGTPAPEPFDVQERLAAAVRLLEVQDAVAAYTYLRDGRPLVHWGAAFFTKFLYFVGHVLNVRGDKPMILDKVLARRMRWFWRRRLSPPQADVFDRYWATYRWSPYRYQVYLTFLRVAADELAGASPTRWSPDLVELVLYRFDPRKSMQG